MKAMLNKLINKTSIRFQLFITVASGIVLLLAALIYASTWVSDQQVRKLLVEQGKQVSANLASNSQLALLYDSVENAEHAIKSTLAFPGVSGVHIYKADATLFYCSDKKDKKGHNHRMHASDVAGLTAPKIFSENRNRWKFIAPVSTRAHDQAIQEQLFSEQANEDEDIIGYVVITSSKGSLKSIDKGILFSNFSIAFIIGLLLLLILQKTMQRLTQPLYSIANIMKKTEQGEYQSQVNTDGPHEIHTIARAYNRMISALTERDEQLRKQNIHLEKQAIHDHLTGLLNRSGFEPGLQIAIDECKTMDAHHALCYMDLDRFKIVNDSCGHNAGDELLKNISTIFKKHIREGSDLLARVGGDEFALILKNCSIEKAQSIGDKICEDIKNYRFNWDDKTFFIGVSIGIIALDENTGKIADVTSRVDSACYAAKASGRGQVYVLDSMADEPSDINNETNIARQIIDQLENNMFRLLCQLISSLKENNKTGQLFEIKLQMLNNDGEALSTEKFQAAAERYGLMARIDHWLIANTLKQLHQHADKTHTNNLYMIGICATSLNDENFIRFIDEQLQTFRIKPGCICFEITETTTINNIDKASRFIKQVHDLGCSVALDDFVSNSSSFAHVHQMDIDYLKIHGDFFKDLTKNPVNHVMTKSINEIAHILDIKTVAEHVDDPASLEEVTALGIDYAQGKAIIEPVLLTECLKQNVAGKM